VRHVAAVCLLALAGCAALLAHDLRAHVDEPVSARILDLAPQQRLREAIRLYERRSPAARRALERVAADDDPRRASQAYDLLALLDYRTRTPAGANRAVADLRTAVRLDPANDVAKANLERVRRLLAARGARPGSAAAGGPRSGGSRGAGSATRGEGY
jgi:hypothetical protein